MVDWVDFAFVFSIVFAWVVGIGSLVLLIGAVKLDEKKPGSCTDSQLWKMIIVFVLGVSYGIAGCIIYL